MTSVLDSGHTTNHLFTRALEVLTSHELGFMIVKERSDHQQLPLLLGKGVAYQVDCMSKKFRGIFRHT